MAGTSSTLQKPLIHVRVNRKRSPSRWGVIIGFRGEIGVVSHRGHLVAGWADTRRLQHRRQGRRVRAAPAAQSTNPPTTTAYRKKGRAPARNSRRPIQKTTAQVSHRNQTGRLWNAYQTPANRCERSRIAHQAQSKTAPIRTPVSSQSVRMSSLQVTDDYRHGANDPHGTALAAPCALQAVVGANGL